MLKIYYYCIIAIFAIIITSASPILASYSPSFQVAQAVTTTTTAPKLGTSTIIEPPGGTTTQNSISTTAPVTSATTISIGSMASDVLQWIMAAFAPVLGSLIVWILVRVLKKLGIDATDALRARLQDIVVNGLNVSAAAAEKQIEGKSPIEIKSQIVQGAVTYIQAHGAETITALGLDPQSGQAVTAIKARIETAIADPSIPTPVVLNPVKVAV